MADYEFHAELPDAQLMQLEKVRQQHGLDNLEQALAMVLKARIRKQVKIAMNKSRALYLVDPVVAPLVKSDDTPCG